MKRNKFLIIFLLVTIFVFSFYKVNISANVSSVKYQSKNFIQLDEERVMPYWIIYNDNNRYSDTDKRYPQIHYGKNPLLCEENNDCSDKQWLDPEGLIPAYLYEFKLGDIQLKEYNNQMYLLQHGSYVYVPYIDNNNDIHSLGHLKTEEASRGFYSITWNRRNDIGFSYIRSGGQGYKVGIREYPTAHNNFAIGSSKGVVNNYNFKRRVSHMYTKLFLDEMPEWKGQEEAHQFFAMRSNKGDNKLIYGNPRYLVNQRGNYRDFIFYPPDLMITEDGYKVSKKLIQNPYNTVLSNNIPNPISNGMINNLYKYKELDIYTLNKGVRGFIMQYPSLEEMLKEKGGCSGSFEENQDCYSKTFLRYFEVHDLPGPNSYGNAVGIRDGGASGYWTQNIYAPKILPLKNIRVASSAYPIELIDENFTSDGDKKVLEEFAQLKLIETDEEESNSKEDAVRKGHKVKYGTEGWGENANLIMEGFDENKEEKPLNSKKKYILEGNLALSSYKELEDFEFNLKESSHDDISVNIFMYYNVKDSDFKSKNKDINPNSKKADKTYQVDGPTGKAIIESVGTGENFNDKPIPSLGNIHAGPRTKEHFGDIMQTTELDKILKFKKEIEIDNFHPTTGEPVENVAIYISLPYQDGHWFYRHSIKGHGIYDETVDNNNWSDDKTWAIFDVDKPEKSNIKVAHRPNQGTIVEGEQVYDKLEVRKYNENGQLGPIINNSGCGGFGAGQSCGVIKEKDRLNISAYMQKELPEEEDDNKGNNQEEDHKVTLSQITMLLNENFLRENIEAISVLDTNSAYTGGKRAIKPTHVSFVDDNGNFGPFVEYSDSAYGNELYTNGTILKFSFDYEVPEKEDLIKGKKGYKKISEAKIKAAEQIDLSLNMELKINNNQEEQDKVNSNKTDDFTKAILSIKTPDVDNSIKIKYIKDTKGKTYNNSDTDCVTIDPSGRYNIEIDVKRESGYGKELIEPKIKVWVDSGNGQEERTAYIKPGTPTRKLEKPGDTIQYIVYNISGAVGSINIKAELPYKDIDMSNNIDTACYGAQFNISVTDLVVSPPRVQLEDDKTSDVVLFKWQAKVAVESYTDMPEYTTLAIPVELAEITRQNTNDPSDKNIQRIYYSSERGNGQKIYMSGLKKGTTERVISGTFESEKVVYPHTDLEFEIAVNGGDGTHNYSKYNKRVYKEFKRGDSNIYDDNVAVASVLVRPKCAEKPCPPCIKKPRNDGWMSGKSVGYEWSRKFYTHWYQTTADMCEYAVAWDEEGVPIEFEEEPCCVGPVRYEDVSDDTEQVINFWEKYELELRYRDTNTDKKKPGAWIRMSPGVIPIVRAGQWFDVEVVAKFEQNRHPDRSTDPYDRGRNGVPVVSEGTGPEPGYPTDTNCISKSSGAATVTDKWNDEFHFLLSIYGSETHTFKQKGIEGPEETFDIMEDIGGPNQISKHGRVYRMPNVGNVQVKDGDDTRKYIPKHAKDGYIRIRGISEPIDSYAIFGNDDDCDVGCHPESQKALEKIKYDKVYGLTCDGSPKECMVECPVEGRLYDNFELIIQIKNQLGIKTQIIGN